jgi:hypothetical protein
MPARLCASVGLAVVLGGASAAWQAAGNAGHLERLRKQIAGRESAPAEEVFRNVQILKGRPASRLPGMMEALTGLLGVECTHCHDPADWPSEAKPPKAIARGHFDLIGALNTEDFGGEQKISCWTCHRGKPTPAFAPDPPPSGTASAPAPNPNIATLEHAIAGREQQPAEQVFKNIRIFTGMPAIRVLRIMELAFTANLGVGCDHCHTPGEWDSDAKREKEVARRMWGIRSKVQERVRKLAARPDVPLTCYTCHKGQAVPEFVPR